MHGAKSLPTSDANSLAVTAFTNAYARKTMLYNIKMQSEFYNCEKNLRTCEKRSNFAVANKKEEI